MFHGSMVALVTPMAPNGDIDYRALEGLLEFHHRHSTDALVIAGTTAEAGVLTKEEYSQLVATIVKVNNNRLPIIVGSGCIGVQQTIEKTQHAMELGADACLLVTPYYVKPSQDGLFEYYQAIAQAVPIPQILYNVPGRTACDLLPSTVDKLAAIANIVGIKEASGDIARYHSLVEVGAGRLDVYSGDDITALDCLQAGGKGVISVSANVAPDKMHELWVASGEDDDRAGAIQESLLPLHRALFVQSNPIPVKWALSRMKLIDSGIRLPLTPLADEYHSIVEDTLAGLGIL